MIDYIVKILNDITEDMNQESATPDVHHLFYISEDATKLSQDDADLFHLFLAQLIYLSHRARPEIQIAVSFLCTRVRGSDTDDCKNMVRLMKYIQWTIGLPLILSIKKSGNIKRYIYAEFSVNQYMRSHTGGFMTTVTVGAYVQSSKQKLNIKSSNEAEIFGVDDVISQVIWTQFLLK